jgi:synaptobrevin family protein YKT6
MKLTAVAVLKFNGPSAEPALLAFAADLSAFGFFQRSTVRELLVFVARTLGRRTAVGQRQTVQQEEYFCHAHNRDGLVGVAFADAEYPARAGFCVAAKVLDDFEAARGEAWRGAAGDAADPADPGLEAALVKFQDPAAADQLARIQRDLDETKVRVFY